jgi:palmitoyl-protein thioesterase
MIKSIFLPLSLFILGIIIGFLLNNNNSHQRTTSSSLSLLQSSSSLISNNVLKLFHKKNKYRPLILIHGINNEPKDWDTFCKVVKKYRKEQITFELKSPFDGVPGSWIALTYQVKWFDTNIRNLISKEKQIFKYGYDLVCHSQGAVICRALIQETDHHVSSFISLAGPQMGVFGDGWISFFPPGLKNLTISNAWEFAYADWAQATLSPANLWHDPHHQLLFVEKDLFMRTLQGADVRDIVGIARRKRNFLKLNKASFLVGNVSSIVKRHNGEEIWTTFDKGIDPWFSGIFSFYNDEKQIISMFDQEIFKKDTFGLKTLFETNRLVTLAVSGVWHDDWIYNEHIIGKYVIPQLSGRVNNKY